MNPKEFESGEIQLNDSDNSQAESEIKEAKERGSYLRKNLVEPKTKPPKRFNLKITSEKLDLEAKEIFAQNIDSFVSQALNQLFNNGITEPITIEISQVSQASEISQDSKSQNISNE